jgi:hypothetical protein
MIKKNNLYLGDIYEVSLMNGVVGAKYESYVNNKLAKANITKVFVPQTHLYNDGKAGQNFVSYKGKVYLKLIRFRKKSTFFYKGKPINSALINPFLKNNPEVLQEITFEGVKRSCVFRNINLDNILEIRYNGKTYKTQTSKV